MIIEFVDVAWLDFTFWMETDIAVAIKIKDLLNSIRQTPFSGLGKPEPLRFNFAGHWSRRITGEHRLVYQVVGKRGAGQRCIVVQCRYHYDK